MWKKHISVDLMEVPNKALEISVGNLLPGLMMNRLTSCVRSIFFNISKKIRSVHGERRGEYRVLVGKPEGKRPLGRPRRRWEDYNKMDL